MTSYFMRFWVQVRRIPSELIAKKIEGLGNFIGDIIEYDPRNSSNF